MGNKTSKTTASNYNAIENKYIEFVHDFHEIQFCMINNLKYSKAIYHHTIEEFEEFMTVYTHETVKNNFANKEDLSMFDSAIQKSLRVTSIQLYNIHRTWLKT